MKNFDGYDIVSILTLAMCILVLMFIIGRLGARLYEFLRKRRNK